MTLIVGAGLTGLIIAHRLHADGHAVTVVEKSRGVGGRMATRRSGDAKFDHGAQFYKLREAIAPLHRRWIGAELTTHWFEKDGSQHFAGMNGMTAFAKNLASGITIVFEERVLKLNEQNSQWSVDCESGRSFTAETVIITAPLPQSLEIARSSALSYDPGLDDLHYAKAVVALLTTKDEIPAPLGHSGYREFTNSSVFSVADQKAKGLSMVPALVATLSPEASESHFDQPDDVLATVISTEILRLGLNIEIETIEIKKWRYSHPLAKSSTFYAEIQSSLYLAGDAFGGPSLNGAARSGNALADVLTGKSARQK